jgi:hypothetical protein
LISENQVSSESVTGYRWEPSSAVGSTWATSWHTITNPFSYTAYVSTWNGSSWRSPSQLVAPNGQPLIDVNLAYDTGRARFVFAGRETRDPTSGSSIWYGYSTDSNGTSWVFGNNGNPVFPGAPGADWDYPSIAVDTQNRVMIGSVKFYGPQGLYTRTSSDGLSFNGPTAPVVSSSGFPPVGAESRIIAAGGVFQAFVATYQYPQHVPIAVTRYWDAAGEWSAGNSELLAQFSPPAASGFSTDDRHIFYAPYLSAAGSQDGLWAVAFPIRWGNYNNIYICTSNRGCGLVNAGADDEFLAGVSVSTEGGYWVSDYAYSTLYAPTLPLIRQAIYFPPGQNGIGATTSTGIDPTQWLFTTDRCTSTCYAAGDFHTIAATASMVSHWSIRSEDT